MVSRITCETTVQPCTECVYRTESASKVYRVFCTRKGPDDFEDLSELAGEEFIEPQDDIRKGLCAEHISRHGQISSTTSPGRRASDCAGGYGHRRATVSDYLGQSGLRKPACTTAPRDFSRLTIALLAHPKRAQFHHITRPLALCSARNPGISSRLSQCSRLGRR